MRIAILFFVSVLLFLNNSWSAVVKNQDAVCFDLLGLHKQDILESKFSDEINYYNTKKMYAACYKKAGKKHILKVIAFSKSGYTVVVSDFDNNKVKTKKNVVAIDYSEYLKLAKSNKLTREEKFKKETYRMSSALVLNMFDKKLYNEKIDPKLFTRDEKDEAKTANMGLICQRLLGFKDSDIKLAVAGKEPDETYYSLYNYYVGCKKEGDNQMNVVTINKQTKDIVFGKYDIKKGKISKNRVFKYNNYLQSLKKDKLTEKEQKEQNLFIFFAKSVLLKLDKNLYEKSFSPDTLKSAKNKNTTVVAPQSTKVASSTTSMPTGSISVGVGVGGVANKHKVYEGQESKRAKVLDEGGKNNAKANGAQSDKVVQNDDNLDVQGACLDVLGESSENLKAYVEGRGQKEFDIYYGADNSYVACRKSKKDPKLIQVAVISKKNYDLAIISYNTVKQEKEGVKFYKYQQYVDSFQQDNLQPQAQKEQRIFNSITKSVLTELEPETYKKDFEPEAIKANNTLKEKSGDAKQDVSKNANIKSSPSVGSNAKKAPSKSSKTKKTGPKAKNVKKTPSKASKTKQVSSKPKKTRKVEDKYKGKSENRVKDFVPDYLLQDLPPALRNK